MFRALALIALLPSMAQAQFVYNPYYRTARWGTPTVVPYTAFYGQPAVSAAQLGTTTCTTCTQQICQVVPHTTYRVAVRQVPVTTMQSFTTVDPCTGCPRVCMRPVTTCVRQCYYVPCTTYHRVCRQVTMPTTCQTAACQPVAAAPAMAVVPQTGCSTCGPAVAAPAPTVIMPQTPGLQTPGFQTPGLQPGLPAPSLLSPPPVGTPVTPPATAPTTAPMTGVTQPHSHPVAAPWSSPSIAQPKEASVASPPSQLKPIAPAVGDKKQPEAPPLLDPRQRTADTSNGWRYTSTTGPALDDRGWVAK